MTYWTVHVMEILIFSAVNVYSRITLLVAMVANHASYSPLQVSPPVRVIGIAGMLQELVGACNIGT